MAPRLKNDVREIVVCERDYLGGVVAYQVCSISSAQKFREVMQSLRRDTQDPKSPFAIKEEKCCLAQFEFGPRKLARGGHRYSRSFGGGTL
jgi:hypothetical protein